MIGARLWKGHFTRGWLFCWLLRVGNIFEKLDYQSGWHESGVWRGLSESNGEPPTCDNVPRVSRAGRGESEHVGSQSWLPRNPRKPPTSAPVARHEPLVWG